ncbi:hypothetical protein GOODEAATRI_020546 [Goodea atripinnis]|uniref:Uncharacterized protein n=1 Tax=Goodea atripinnis TaxID=208336 RepID=A0ABV0MJP6_9TELE
MRTSLACSPSSNLYIVRTTTDSKSTVLLVLASTDLPEHPQLIGNSSLLSPNAYAADVLYSPDLASNAFEIRRLQFHSGTKKTIEEKTVGHIINTVISKSLRVTKCSCTTKMRFFQI